VDLKFYKRDGIDTILCLYRRTKYYLDMAYIQYNMYLDNIKRDLREGRIG